MRIGRVTLTILAALTALAAHLALALAPRPAYGAAGERKVFAAGAGARALSLGGAYTSSADDATALVWNPAGLLSIASKEVAFYTTTLPGEDLSYAFAGYAQPTLRLGTFGVGALRFSAGGIEGRDERNFVTDGAVRDTQMRWLFGYASRLSPAVALGVGLKLDTHTLGGASATSFGSDLGMTVRSESLGPSALSRLGAGVRLENALAPREKLGASTATDPRALHMALTYEIPFGRPVRSALAGAPSGLLATAEWVREAGGESHLLAGAELSAAGASLRAGRAASSWTAGGGVSLRSVGVDYAYAPGDLGASHRVSLRYKFGQTISEMRAAAAARAEAEVNARIVREMSAREAERVTALLDSGRAALASGHFDEARSAFEGALLFVPGSVEAEALRRSAEEQGLVAAARARAAAGDTIEALVAYRRALEANPANEAARREAAQIEAARDVSRAAGTALREREAAGIEALASGRHAEALSLLRAALDAEPENADVRRLYQLAQSGLDREVDLLVSQGTLLEERGLADRAVAKWREALALSPDDRALKQRIATAETRSDRSPAPPGGTAAAAAPARRAALSPEQQAETADLYERGVGAFQAGRTAEAIAYWEIVWRRDPAHGEVGAHLTKGYLIQGMEHYTSGRLAEAIETWRRALEVEPADGKALSYVERATSELAKTRNLTRR
jgi:tetratricopeptide (TPR) repeat protein